MEDAPLPTEDGLWLIALHLTLPILWTWLISRWFNTTLKIVPQRLHSAIHSQTEAGVLLMDARSQTGTLLLTDIRLPMAILLQTALRLMKKATVMWRFLFIKRMWHPIQTGQYRKCNRLNRLPGPMPGVTTQFPL